MRHISTLAINPVALEGTSSVVGGYASATEPPAGSNWEDLYSSRTMQVLVMASTGASAFHGYRRNQSVGWAVWWGLMGAVFPIVTPAIAVAQGFGKKA